MRTASIRLLTAVGLVALGLSPLATQDRDGEAREPRERRADRQHFTCGTTVADEQGRARAVAALADGMPLSYVQEPAIVSPSWAGPIRIRNLTVVGDVGEIAFRRQNATESVTWSRARTATIDGRVVSVFDLEWPNAELAESLRTWTVSYDYPEVLWGRLFVPGDRETGRGVYLRTASSALPAAAIARIDDTVQFSSHVVNIVMPTFGDGRVGGGDQNFELQAVALKFFEHFADEYDSLAVVPQAGAFADYSAFHRNVQNAVSGVGLDVFDASRRYGSGGRLRSLEVFLGSSLATHRTSNHEISHQWGHFMDWTRITGVTRAGWEPSAHSPLMSGPETLIGAVLDGRRRVVQSGDAFVVEWTPYPIRQHPFEKYGMGLLAPDDVPEVMLFEEQGQFGEAVPAPGTAVTGAARRVGINDIMAAYGARSGPVTTEWKRATVVVSREGLLSPAEMSYWNFFSARLEDPQGSGVPSVDGYVSFDGATDRAVDLQTGITPRKASPVALDANVDSPAFAATDCPYVGLNATVPSVLSAGQEFRVEGQVTATDRSDFNQILIRLWKYGATASDAALFRETISSAGTFNARVRVPDGAEGRYYFEVFLFWPGSGPQSARCTFTPVIVR